MPIFPLECAMANSPEVELSAASTVNLAPADESVDSNRVHITGTGTINSFGVAYGYDAQPDLDILDEDGNVVGTEPVPPLRPPWSVTKHVRFDVGITLHHNPPTLDLLSKADRLTRDKDFGIYTSDGDGLGHWTEEDFKHPNTDPTNPPPFQRSIIYYTTSQTLTIPAFAQSALVTMVGGGGYALGNYSSAGAGGCGGYLEKALTNLVPGNTLVLTVGAGGNATSQNGGNTVLAAGTQIIATITAAGGGHGNGVGGVGGIATGGDLNISGGDGRATASDPYGTYNAEMSTGGNPLSPPQSTRGIGLAVAGKGYGGGALAAGDPNQVFTNFSANGAPGVCKIDWTGIEPK